MKTSSAVLLTIAMAATSLTPHCVDAKKEYVARLPNGANVDGVPALGHSDGTGDRDSTNAFGNAFEKAGKKWTTAFCQADTDGDGQTNGQELGDPCCTWTQGSTPTYMTGVSHPGDASKTADSTLWANINCSTTTTAPSPASSSSAAASSNTASIVATSALAVVAVALTQW